MPLSFRLFYFMLHVIPSDCDLKYQGQTSFSLLPNTIYLSNCIKHINSLIEEMIFVITLYEAET